MPLILHQVAVVLLGGAGVLGRRPLLLLFAIIKLMQERRLLCDLRRIHCSMDRRGLVVHRVGVAVGSERIWPGSTFSLVLNHFQDALVLVLRLQLVDVLPN